MDFYSILKLEKPTNSCNNFGLIIDISINKIKKASPMIRNGRQRNFHSINFDRGRRHYWNDQKGDYGFNQSVDRRLFYRLDNPQVLRRNHTVQREYNNYQTEGLLYHSLKHQNCGQDGHNCAQIEQSPNKRKNLQIDNKIIEVKLPNIRKTKQKATQSDELSLNLSNLEKHNDSHVQLGSAKKKYVSRTVQQEDQRKVRVRSQINQYGYEKRARKVRYSPTYVCSFRNPLPTFKLYNPNSNAPVYQYGFNDLA